MRITTEEAGSDLRFRARPFVCGALGAWDQSLLDALTAASPARLTRVFQSGNLTLFSSARLPSWRSADRRGYHWGALVHDAPPRHWKEASESRIAVGIEIGPKHVALHADALGMQDLYYRRIGDGVYFSGRIEPLLEVGDSKLHIDWGAWASTLAMISPVGEDTPFTEVRRLGAANAWTWHDERLRKVSFEPSWMTEEPDPGFSAAEAVEVVANAVRPTRRTAITISGGWDSRLLGILAARQVRKMRAWTTSTDDGRDRDISYAAPVAEALGMRHRLLIPDDHAWATEHAEVRRRLQFQTGLHTWIMPLARYLHHRGTPLLDGLAGDVLFKASFVPDEAFTRQNAEAGWLPFWERREQGRLRDNTFLRLEVLEWLTDQSRSSFSAAMTPFAGHHAAVTLGRLHTRTARTIAGSPLWLMSPEIEVKLPFLHPEVIKAALRVPVEDKLGGAFYRAMLEAADPRVAALPSTNDPRPEKPGPIGPRRQTAPASLRILTDHIRSSELAQSLFTPAARADLLDPDVHDPVRGNTRRFRVLTWASLLSHWIEHHQAHLEITDLPVNLS